MGSNGKFPWKSPDFGSYPPRQNPPGSSAVLNPRAPGQRIFAPARCQAQDTQPRCRLLTKTQALSSAKTQALTIKYSDFVGFYSGDCRVLHGFTINILGLTISNRDFTINNWGLDRQKYIRLWPPKMAPSPPSWGFRWIGLVRKSSPETMGSKIPRLIGISGFLLYIQFWEP